MNKRILNGYYAIQLSDEEIINHTKLSNNESNWKNYVYEHRYVAEKKLGRKLTKKEIVHHLDCDKLNNEQSNLIILADRRSHALLHAWIDAGANVHDSYVPKVTSNYGKPKPLCKICNNAVNDHDNEYCSHECANIASRKTERPTLKQLLTLLQYNSYTYVANLYGVSDNAVRKWIRKYGYDPKTFEPL